MRMSDDRILLIDSSVGRISTCNQRVRNHTPLNHTQHRYDFTIMKDMNVSLMKSYRGLKSNTFSQEYVYEILTDTLA
jgi:hypothetical protein